MKFALTWRRASGASLLLAGGFFLVIGALTKSQSSMIWGLSAWLAALLAVGVTLIQRVNAITKLVRASSEDVGRLAARHDSSAAILKRNTERVLFRTDKVAGRTERLLHTTDKLVSDAGTLAKELSRLSETQASDASRSWNETTRLALSIEGLNRTLRGTDERVASFQSQFGEFVAALAEWLAIAESQSKDGMSRISEAQESTREALMNAIALLQGAMARIVAELEQQRAKTESVTSVLDNVRTAVQAAGDQSALRDLAAQLEGVTDSLSEAKREIVLLESSVSIAGKQLASISSDVNEIVPAQRAELARARIEQANQVEAILQLQALLPTDRPTPLLGDWAMDPVSVLGLVTELMERRPQLVLECGSGTSTIWIAKTLKQIGHGRLISLEHLDVYRKVTVQHLTAHGLSDVARVKLAPLKPYSLGGETFQWYDLSGVDLAKRSVDLLLVDGPPGSVSRLARYPALPVLKDFLADDAIVVMDDVLRPAEQEEVDRWLTETPELSPLRHIGSRTTMFSFIRTTKRGADVHQFPFQVEQATTS